MKNYLTIDDFDLSGKTVLCRVDFNSPMDPKGKILDDKRFRSHITTLKDLEDSKVVLIAHQSRPGKSDFTTMELHAETLSKLMRREIGYVDDIFGSHAIDHIKKMDNGEIILLENARFYSEESLERTPADHARTIMVKKLSNAADFFMNDGFSVSHRSHLSVTGFTETLPSMAGRVMEKEIDSLDKGLHDVKRPCIFVLGGTKVDDSLRVTENVLKKGSADRVLATGVVANVFLAASGVNIGKNNMALIEKQGYIKEIERAKKLLDAYNDKIGLPFDVALEKNGERIDVPVSGFNSDLPIFDIGLQTMVAYSEEIKNSGTVIMNGPAGVFEKEDFALGTTEIVKAGMKSGFSIVGGGHISVAVEQLGLEEKFSHVSTGGGACIDFLAGEALPGIVALKEYARKYRCINEP